MICKGVHSIESWTQPASWKNKGRTKIMHIFMKVGGKERLRGNKAIFFIENRNDNTNKQALFYSFVSLCAAYEI